MMLRCSVRGWGGPAGDPRWMALGRAEGGGRGRLALLFGVVHARWHWPVGAEPCKRLEAASTFIQYGSLYKGAMLRILGHKNAT